MGCDVTNIYSQTLRGQRGKRERLGTRLRSENLIRNLNIFTFVIILLILITFPLDGVRISVRRKLMLVTPGTLRGRLYGTLIF